MNIGISQQRSYERVSASRGKLEQVQLQQIKLAGQPVSFGAGILQATNIFTRPLAKDTLSFTSIEKPTRQENDQVAKIQKFLEQNLLDPIKKTISKVSALVNLKAYEAILLLDPLKYTKVEKENLKKTEKMAMAMIEKYDKGNNIPQAIEDFKKQGCKFLLADDLLPKDLWKDEGYLQAWNWSESKIEAQIEDPKPLRVRDVLRKKGSAEIQYLRKDCKALFLFHDKKPTKDSFWHEMFHYCQHKSGLKSATKNNGENVNSSFAKRELETYQFIINNWKLLNLKEDELRLNIQIWNSYKDSYHHEKNEK